MEVPFSGICVLKAATALGVQAKIIFWIISSLHEDGPRLATTLVLLLLSSNSLGLFASSTTWARECEWLHTDLITYVFHLFTVSVQYLESMQQRVTFLRHPSAKLHSHRRLEVRRGASHFQLQELHPPLPSPIRLSTWEMPKNTGEVWICRLTSALS